MNRVVAALVLLTISAAAPPARAQDPPPRIPIFVVDVHGAVPKFPQGAPLAASRGLALAELPGNGLGMQIGAHLNFFKWRAITFGFGGQALAARATRRPPKGTDAVRVVTEQFRSLGSQLSFNFGTGHGWSYLSGGIGQSIWSIIPEGENPLFGDEERLKTINYGGGARWFAKPHLAFSFDVRFYAINPGAASAGFPGKPRTTFLVIGAGASVK